MFHTGGDCVACQPLLFPTIFLLEFGVSLFEFGVSLFEFGVSYLNSV